MGVKMVYGLVIDIIHVEKFRSLVNDKFILNISLKMKGGLRIEKLVGRFAVQEALFKAMKDRWQFKFEDIQTALKGKQHFALKIVW